MLSSSKSSIVVPLGSPFPQTYNWTKLGLITKYMFLPQRKKKRGAKSFEDQACFGDAIVSLSSFY